MTEMPKRNRLFSSTECIRRQKCPILSIGKIITPRSCRCLLSFAGSKVAENTK